MATDGKPALARGISIDITARKQAELELHERRDELAHLSRVTMLGELSGSLAHELNQPLTAILSNAQAAEFYLAADAPDLALVREILADIVTEDERAGDVIQRLRLLLRRGEVQRQSLDAGQVVTTVLKLAHNDLNRHGVTVATALAPDLPPIRCDDVQLQQVLLNFVMNACDALLDNAADDRLLTVRTCADGDGSVRIEVCDNGRGLPDGGEGQAFERYFTTKPHGLGLGLSVCRTIISAHGGKLGAANNKERGATFYCSLPWAKEARFMNDRAPTVFVVDDDAAVRKAVSRLLLSKGIGVAVVRFSGGIPRRARSGGSRLPVARSGTAGYQRPRTPAGARKPRRHSADHFSKRAWRCAASASRR